MVKPMHQDLIETTLDSYAAVGAALVLLAQSPYHQGRSMTEYFNQEILPPIHRQQYRVYFAKTGNLAAFITWAALDVETEKDIHTTGRAIALDEWSCGDRFLVNDLVAPDLELVSFCRNHLLGGIFKNAPHVSSIRRHEDGSIRRIQNWDVFRNRADTFERLAR